METTQTTLFRDDYGSLHQNGSTSEADCLAYLAAYTLVSQAAKSGKIPAAFDGMEWGRSGKERGHKIGEARHHEIYDFTASTVLVCARSVEGTRYGQKTTNKEYFLVSRHGRGVKVAPANKALAAKGAKISGNILGGAIAIVLGKSTYRAPANKICTGYKMVVRDDSGDLVSAWDGSAWSIGKTRVEAATEDHRGGFYYYATIEEAIAAAAANDTFGSDINHRRLVVVEVEASGRHFKHGSEVATKLCASRIRPVREVAMTI
jgi:hypothetical protein